MKNEQDRIASTILEFIGGLKYYTAEIKKGFQMEAFSF